jgi:ABC-type amino acid transport substrate-binding protein
MSRELMVWLSLCAACLGHPLVVRAGEGDLDLAQVKQAGVLRHLGVPYANFVTGSGDGMSIELMRGFAKHLGVRYEYVPAEWATVIPDLIGRQVAVREGKAELGEPTPIRGDVIANGLTNLAWRRQVLDFSDPVFPTQVWLLARADDPLRPIKASGTIESDIAQARALLDQRRVLCKARTCLDPGLFDLEGAGATPSPFAGSLNELAPAMIAGEADNTILDVPDAVIAMAKWPGRIKILGPMCKPQVMGVGFRKSAPQLRQAFNAYLAQCRADGSYLRLVRQYYPSITDYFPDFFEAATDTTARRDSSAAVNREHVVHGQAR